MSSYDVLSNQVKVFTGSLKGHKGRSGDGVLSQRGKRCNKSFKKGDSTAHFQTVSAGCHC